MLFYLPHFRQLEQIGFVHGNTELQLSLVTHRPVTHKPGPVMLLSYRSHMTTKVLSPAVLHYAFQY